MTPRNSDDLHHKWYSWRQRSNGRYVTSIAGRSRTPVPRSEPAAAVDHKLSREDRELGNDRTQIRRWMKRFELSRDEDE